MLDFEFDIDPRTNAHVYAFRFDGEGYIAGSRFRSVSHKDDVLSYAEEAARTGMFFTGVYHLPISEQAQSALTDRRFREDLLDDVIEEHDLDAQVLVQATAIPAVHARWNWYRSFDKPEMLFRALTERTKRRVPDSYFSVMYPIKPAAQLTAPVRRGTRATYGEMPEEIGLFLDWLVSSSVEDVSQRPRWSRTLDDVEHSYALERLTFLELRDRTSKGL